MKKSKKNKQQGTLSDHFLGCLLGGALGDSLGAPLEINRDFADLYARYGDTGLDHIIAYDPNISWGDSDMRGPGVITDDTTMMAATLEAMNRTLDEKGDIDRFLHLSWQTYLRWGELQQEGHTLKQHQEADFAVSDQLKPFLFSCGAGRGTIAALQVGRYGTPENPLVYDTVIRGKRMISPNKGCGGMMRVAPIAFLSNDADDIFNHASRNGAITHSDPGAYLASGCVALMVHHMKNGHTGAFTILQVAEYLQQNHPASGAECIDALYTVLSMNHPISTKTINAIPKILNFDDPFLAVPVLAQVAYALDASDFMPGMRVEKFAKTLSLAVTHSGDSDSVGAIVGNCLGARWGQAALPTEWLNTLVHTQAIKDLAGAFIKRNDRFIPAHFPLTGIVP